MVDIALLQSVSYIAGALGVCVAAFYYVSMIRNIEKSRRRDVVFQKLNVNMLDYYKTFFEVMKMVDWDTFEEFEKKYSYWDNHEARAKIQYVLNHYNGLGILIREGIVDADEIYKQYSVSSIVEIYEKFKPYLDRYKQEYMKDFRFLYSETKRRYPNVSTPGLARSKEETLERARKHDASYVRDTSGRG